jgi:glycosyltransferase involved in cell wall biosynthesis
LANILEQYNVSVVLISSIWPETFCYTASEALLLGYPVIACNVGAQADRVRRFDAGWVVDGSYLDGFVKVVQQITSSPETVNEKSLNAGKYLPVSPATHFSNISGFL